jgi:cytoskeletal protein CcmA (bactofilin family)
MFEFNKRDVSEKGEEFPARDEPASQASSRAPQPAAARPATSSREAAVIGPSIHIEGELHGEEDLIIEGEVRGTVHLKHHSLTIGSKGKITADVYANAVIVDGYMHGDLYGAERISIRKSAQVQGNVNSPRVSVEDGAQFKGTIEMDPDSEALQSAFGDRSGSSRSMSAATSAPPKTLGANPGAGNLAGKTESTATGTTAKSGKTG